MKRRSPKNGSFGEHPAERAASAHASQRPGEFVDAQDRLLDFALEELERERRRGGSRHVDPDLVDRVRSAWIAGERGQDLAELDAPPARAKAALRVVEGKRSTGGPTAGVGQAREAGARARSRRVAAVAAALVVVGGGALVLRGFAPWGTPAADVPTAGGAPTLAGSTTAPREETDQRLSLAASLPLERRASLRDLVALCLRPSTLYRDNARELELARGVRRELLAQLEEDPAAWAFLDLELERADAEHSIPPLAVPHLIALAREAPESYGTPFARALWLRTPAAFGAPDLIAFAERDLFEFQRELVARALEQDAAFSAEIGGRDVLAAAWLVNRHDTRGLSVLDAAIDETPLETKDLARLSRVDHIALAGSLVQLERGGDAWSRAHARVTDYVAALLPKGDLERASMAVAVLEFFQDAPAPPEFPVATYEADVATLLAEQAWRETDAEALRARLASLAEWVR